MVASKIDLSRLRPDSNLANKILGHIQSYPPLLCVKTAGTNQIKEIKVRAGVNHTSIVRIPRILFDLIFIIILPVLGAIVTEIIILS